MNQRSSCSSIMWSNPNPHPWALGRKKNNVLIVVFVYSKFQVYLVYGFSMASTNGIDRTKYKVIHNLPIRGLSDVIGMIDDTVFRNIVRDNSMVTPNIRQ